MVFKLSDGTEVEYYPLTPADTAAVVSQLPENATMFTSVIRLAVVNADEVLSRIRALPNPLGETALLGTEIVLAALRAQARLNDFEVGAPPALGTRGAVAGVENRERRDAYHRPLRPRRQV
jgi:hypothetical protein